jgi:hypothetical protein
LHPGRSLARQSRSSKPAVRATRRPANRWPRATFRRDRPLQILFASLKSSWFAQNVRGVCRLAPAPVSPAPVCLNEA